MAKQQVEVTVSNRTVLRVLLLIVATFLVLNFIGNISHPLKLIFIAAFLSLALNPAVTWLARKLGIKSRVGATAIAYLAVLAVVIFFSTVVIYPLIKQSIEFVRDAPQAVNELKHDTDTPIGRFIQRNNLEDEIDNLSDNIRDRTRNVQQPVVATAGRIGGVLISIITIMVLTFMMLIEGPRWLDRYLSLQPKENREHQRRLGLKMYNIISGYVIGQLLLALIASLMTLVVLLIASNILNVSINAVALAGILFVTGLIPMVGHMIGGTIIVIACAFVSFPLAIIMAIYLILHQQIENVTLQPYIQAKYNELTPLLVFIAALVGVGFGGLLGALIAIPAAGCLRVLVQDHFDRRAKRLEA